MAEVILFLWVILNLIFSFVEQNRILAELLN